MKIALILVFVGLAHALTQDELDTVRDYIHDEIRGGGSLQANLVRLSKYCHISILLGP
jgi:hypothetical protein